jgi:hypothetical protein
MSHVYVLAASNARREIRGEHITAAAADQP